MTRQGTYIRATLLTLWLGWSGCSSPEPVYLMWGYGGNGPPGGSGGLSGSGGVPVTDGTGGAQLSSGGASGTGASSGAGATSVDTGGTSGTGGLPASGGVSGTGGGVGTGGAPGSSGGTSGTAGVTGSGGGTSGTGGGAGKGGSGGTSGQMATGGANGVACIASIKSAGYALGGHACADCKSNGTSLATACMNMIDCLSPQYPASCTMNVNCRTDCLNKSGDATLGACVDAIVASCK